MGNRTVTTLPDGREIRHSHSGAHRYGYDALGRLTQAEGERFRCKFH
ncbi:hypothetical protein [Mixta calida]